METQSQALHPSAASLVRDDEDVRDDMAYFRKLGIPYEPKSLIEVLTRHEPKSAMPIACHSLADMRAKEAIPVLKSLADFPIQDVKATSILAVARLCGKDETPWLVECLTRKGTLKGYVLWALAAVADPRAYAAVKAWFVPQLRKLERNPEADSRGNVVYAVAYLEQMTQHYPEVSELLERFRKIAPQLPGNIPSELAFFTRMFSAWKTNPPKRKSDA
jgi:HEAT repeat protein